MSGGQYQLWISAPSLDSLNGVFLTGQCILSYQIELIAFQCVTKC